MMSKAIVLILFCGYLVVSFSQQEKINRSQLIHDFQSAEQILRKAETYSPGLTVCNTAIAFSK